MIHWLIEFFHNYYSHDVPSWAKTTGTIIFGLWFALMGAGALTEMNWLHERMRNASTKLRKYGYESLRVLVAATLIAIGGVIGVFLGHWVGALVYVLAPFLIPLIVICAVYTLFSWHQAGTLFG